MYNKYMLYWKLRTTIFSEVSAQNIQSYVRKISTKWICAYEVGDETKKPHFHFYLETDKNPSTMRSHLRLKCSLVGNEAYSLHETDPDPIEYWAYCVKNPQHEFCGFTETEIAQIYEYDKQVKSSIKLKKEKKKTILSRLTEGYSSYRGDCLYDYIIQFHLQEGLPIRRFQIQCYYDTIMFNLVKDQPEERRILINNIFFKK